MRSDRGDDQRLTYSYDALQAQPGKETALGSDPNLGAALWELSERLVKQIVGEDALVSWTASD